MKHLLLTALSALLLTSICIPVTAQISNTEYSTPFDEPPGGKKKLLQLENGNTFLFYFTYKKGIEITVYGKNRKVIATNQLTSNLWDPKKMKASKIVGIYEIDKQPVLFIYQVLDRIPTLFRVKINAQTGKLDGEMKICTLPKLKSGSAWAMAYGGVKAPEFYVEKDPNSDNYAVVNFNSFAGESDERVEVIHYSIVDGKHKRVSQAFYDTQGFKYLNFLGMVVKGDENVFITTYGYNTKKSGGKDSRLIISRLNAGEKEFTNKKLEFSDDFKETSAILQYNPGSKALQLLTLTYLKNKGGMKYFVTLMSYIDPQSLFIVSTKPILNVKASEYMERNYGDAKGNNGKFIGLPQTAVINSDFSTTILFEENTQIITYNSSGAIVSAQTALGKIAVTQLDTKGNEQEGMAIIKAQNGAGLIDEFYVKRKTKGIFNLTGLNANSEFVSFDYISSKNNNYILYNDYVENFDDDKSTIKRKNMVRVSESNTVLHKLKYAGYDKFYLFGRPANDNFSTFSFIESSHFQKSTSTYATLVIKREKRKKQAHVAWVKLD